MDNKDVPLTNNHSSTPPSQGPEQNQSQSNQSIMNIETTAVSANKHKNNHDQMTLPRSTNEASNQLSTIGQDSPQSDSISTSNSNQSTNLTVTDPNKRTESISSSSSNKKCRKRTTTSTSTSKKKNRKHITFSSDNPFMVKHSYQREMKVYHIHSYKAIVILI
jgi:hypothetical protein